MNQHYSVSIALIHALLKYVARLGLDPLEVCREIDHPLEVSKDAKRRFPASKFLRIWTEIVDRVGDPDFGLHFVENLQHQPAGDILTAVMFNCSTAGEAMERLAHYHDLSTDLIQIRVDQQEKDMCYAWEPKLGNLPVDRHISEAVIGRLYFTLTDLAEGKVKPATVRFRHPRPDRISEHQRIFNCPISFGQPRDEILIPREILDVPIQLAHAGILIRLEAVAQEMLSELYAPDTWSEQVSRQIGKLLLQGKKPSIDEIAGELALGKRQLQRNLRKDGTTYQILLDQVRQELAIRYLKEPRMALYDVAFLLGYSDQSAFNHAFKRWTRCTPMEYLRSSRSQASQKHPP